MKKSKDVDGFHPLNVARLWQETTHMEPFTPKGIMYLLKEVDIDLKGKRAVVIGCSNFVGLPIFKMLLDANAAVTICHTLTVDLVAETRRAEIFVVTAGHSKMVPGDMVSEGVVLIDVGIDRNHETGNSVVMWFSILLLPKHLQLLQFMEELAQ